MEQQIFNTADLDWEEKPVGRVKELVGSAVTDNGRVRIICLDPGEKVESHEHDFLQCMYFTKGDGTVMIDDTKESIKPGLTAIVLPKQCHTVTNEGESKMEIIVFEITQIAVQNTPFVDF